MTTIQQPTGDNNRFERGLALLKEIGGPDGPAVLESLGDIAPDLGRLTVEFGYGDILSRPGLTLRERELTTVGALAALGHAAPQLRWHINGALNVGCTRTEIVEVLIHASVYAGFPAALNGLTAAEEVFAARTDLPDEPAPAPAPTGARFERGTAALSEIDGQAGEQVVAALQDIAPDFARLLVEFSFGDIYARPGLDLKTREMVTVAMCTALGVAPQLGVHVHGLLNVGGSEQEVVEVLIQMVGYAGFPAALNAIAVARTVFAERRSHRNADA